MNKDQPSLFPNINTHHTTTQTEINKQELNQLLKELSVCDRCLYSKSRNSVVLGDGDPTSNIWVVGECPGPDEDLQGLPFVGVTGQLLRKVLTDIGATSDKIYITNRVRCKPTNGLNPDTTALEACSPWLGRQVEIVNPDVVVSIGRYSTAFFLELPPEQTKITKLTGQRFFRGGRIIIPIFHPSYAKRRNMPDAEYMQHFHQLKNIITS